MTAERMDADQAYRLGMVLTAEVTALARRLANGPPLALAAIKGNLNARLGPALDAVLEDERIARRRLFPSADFREGVAAFIGRRAAEFKGE